MDKKSLDKLVKQTTNSNITYIKIGKKISNNYFNLNIDKTIFVKLLDIFDNNSKKYQTYYSYKYYNYIMNIYEKKREYYSKTTQNWFEIFNNDTINMIGINSCNNKLQSIDYPSVIDYHNIEFIEEIRLNNKKITIHFVIKNDNYQIYLSYIPSVDITNDLIELINTIQYTILDNKNNNTISF